MVSGLAPPWYTGVSSAHCGKAALCLWLAAWGSAAGCGLCSSAASGAAQFIPVASLAVDLGLAAAQRAESSQTKDGTRSPCACRWVLNHWTTKEFPNGPTF